MKHGAEQRVLVTGAGGFIGSHLVRYLKERHYWVRGVDLKLPEFGHTLCDEFYLLDLRRRETCLEAMQGMTDVYALAADMGGMGFISSNHATILRNNALINLHSIEAARVCGVSRYLFTSSACVYPQGLQDATDVPPLKESDVFPADPQDAYGWEKLLAELLCRYFSAEFGLDTRTVRFHNIYGPEGTYRGGREKAPAAICRKVAEVVEGGHIEIWGDGEQTRSFCYIDDCVEGVYRLMQSDHPEPLNLGSDEMVSINELAELAIGISGKRHVGIRHVEGPQGVRGRNSDNRMLSKVLGWEPQVKLSDGLAITYDWIDAQVKQESSVA